MDWNSGWPPPSRRWRPPIHVGAATDDPVSHFGQFGRDPANVDFGATRFRSEAINRGDSWNPFSFADHSRYYNYLYGTDPSRHIPSESLRAVALITSGQGARLSSEGLRADGRTDAVPASPSDLGKDDPETNRRPGG